MNWHKPLALALVCLFGAAILPIQSRLNNDARAAHLRKTALNLDLRERIGQAGQRIQTGGGLAILNLAQHAATDAGFAGDLGNGQVLL